MTLLLFGNQDAQTHATLEMQAELNGLGQGWIDIAADVQRTPALQLDYGIAGAGPTDLVASTGRMTFALNNGQGNSANLLGYYSPDNSNRRSGWAIGIGIRLVYRLAGVVYYKFNGTLDSVDPISGKYGERKVLCTVVDWMDEAAIYRPNVAAQVSKRADEILTTLVAAVPRQPKGTSFSTGASTFAFALDNDLNERDPVLTVLQRLAQSENGRIYIKGDTVGGGVLTFESRTDRFSPTSAATFNDTMISLSAPHDRSLLINRVKTTTHPRTVDAAATTILFTLSQVSPSIHTVPGGATTVIEGDYTDAANRSARVGGTDMVTPVATTDYLMNSAADGSGTNLTASFTVTAEYGSNRVKYTITNGSVSTGYVRLLQARGRGLYDYTPIDTISTDSASISSYGERQLAMDMPYESGVSAALDVGTFILATWANPAAVALAMPLIPPTSTDLATMIAREPGHAITITETVTGINTIYFINHVSMSFETLGLPTGDIVNFEWTLQKALAIPVVRSRITSSMTTNVLTHTVLMPSGVASGDLLISVFSADDNALITWPAGWTEFIQGVEVPFGGTRTSIAYRKADGTEGSSISVTTDSAQESTHVTLRIVGAADPATRAPEASSALDINNDFFGSNWTIQMPTLTPTGGTKNYLWLAVAAFSGLPATSPTYTIPTNYGNTSFQAPNLDGWNTLVSERLLRASSEKPGVIQLNLSASHLFISFTVAIHPATF